VKVSGCSFPADLCVTADVHAGQCALLLAADTALSVAAHAADYTAEQKAAAAEHEAVQRGLVAAGVAEGVLVAQGTSVRPVVVVAVAADVLAAQGTVVQLAVVGTFAQLAVDVLVAQGTSALQAVDSTFAQLAVGGTSELLVVVGTSEQLAVGDTGTEGLRLVAEAAADSTAWFLDRSRGIALFADCTRLDSRVPPLVLAS